MVPKRIGRDDMPERDRSLDLPTTSEVLRQSESRAGEDASPKKDEEKLSIFWRVFGGTILSIAALVVITIYQSFASTLHEMRTDIARINEGKAEFLKKDEFNSHKTSVWNRFETVNGLSNSLVGVQNRVNGLEEHRRALEAESKEQQALAAGLDAVRARLTALDQQAKQIEQNQKDLQAASVALGALQEKSRLRDEELKGLHEGLARDEMNTNAALEAIKARCVPLEQAFKVADADHKLLDDVHTAVSSLIDKSMARDAELKSVHEVLKADSDRLKALADSVKECQTAADAVTKRAEVECKAARDEFRQMERDFQALRERMAKLEGSVEKGATVRPSARPATKPKGEEEASPE